MDEDSRIISHSQSGFDLVLLSNFVHQIVNPLNGVAGTLDNLAENVIKDEQRREQRLRAARAQLEQCISLMRNLAYFAQGFQALRAEERREILVPEQIIRSAMFFQEDAALKGIKIYLAENKISNRVKGHMELLSQVYINLFDNAVKYAEPNTEIEVHQWIQKSSSDLLVSVKNKMKVKINRVELDRIFNLGYRGVNARQIVASGTGIGMYICKEIIERVHGGSISVQIINTDEIEFLIRLPGGYFKPYATGELT